MYNYKSQLNVSLEVLVNGSDSLIIEYSVLSFWPRLLAECWPRLCNTLLEVTISVLCLKLLLRLTSVTFVNCEVLVVATHLTHAPGCKN